MKAAVLEKPKEMKLKNIPVPEFSEDQVLVRVKEVGVCGSDVHFYNTGRLGDLAKMDGPIILGHESSGIVEEIGKNVSGFEVGDKVAIEPGVPCYKCDYCKSGDYHLCGDVEFMAIPPNNGSYREYIAYDPHFLYKVSDKISFSQAACVEPFSVGYSCAINSNLKPGDSVCILGAGPIGLASLDLCYAMGASKVYISDINDYRLDIAQKHGAFLTINSQEKDLVSTIMEKTKNMGVDTVIETAGFVQTIKDSINVAKKGGSIAWVSLNQDIVDISYLDIVCKELNIKGVFRYKNSYKPIINLLEAEKINFDGWVSHKFSLEKINEAFELASDKNVNKMKIMITI